MQDIKQLCWKAARKCYGKLFPDTSFFGRNQVMFPNKAYANYLIYRILTSQKPCMIARFGAFELNCLVNYLGVKKKCNNSFKTFVKGQSPEPWWNKTLLGHMNANAGFFPVNEENIIKFCELLLEDMACIDILGSWLKEERFFYEELKYAKRVVLEDMEPFFAVDPWTHALKNKKVLVVHPFHESIKKQYTKREYLFDNDLLPEFELKTLEAVQSVAGIKTRYKNWFEALDSMKARIDQIDFDFCIIGAGAYGFPLAAHVKRMGKKSIHLGGVTQLLFGIKGKRWETYFVYPYINLFNEYWIRPGENEKPQNANTVEGGCYW